MAENRIEIWLKDWNNLYKQLPVNPAKIEYTSPYGLNTVSIASLGEVALAGERGLQTISFSSFFPRDYNPSYCEYRDFEEPWKWVEQIEAWRDTRKNIRIIIAGTPISIPAFVEEFELEPEKAGAPGDIYYTITFKQARGVRVKQIANANTTVSFNAVASLDRPSSSKQRPKTHKVVYYETLFSLAKRYYGDISEWQRIYDANKKVIGKGTTVIKDGMVLMIP